MNRSSGLIMIEVYQSAGRAKDKSPGNFQSYPLREREFIVSIVTQCTHCGKKLKAPEAHIGQSAKCPACHKPFPVKPVAQSSSGKSAGTAAGVAAASGPQATVTQPAAAPASSATWRMKTNDGNEYGPVTREELDGWLAEGRLDVECQVLCEGWEQWKWADEVFPKISGPSENDAAVGFSLGGGLSNSVESANDGAGGIVVKPEPVSVKASAPINRPPDYFWLKFMGYVYTVLGLGIMGLCAVSLIISLVSLGVGVAKDASRGGDDLPVLIFAGPVFMLVIHGIIFLQGAIVLAGGQALFAFRDIAQNSWRTVSHLARR